jgi:hypothetical protein
MPKFFNTSRGPVSFITTSGKVASAAPKTWIQLDSREATSDSLLQLVRRGILVRAAEEDTSNPPQAHAPVTKKPVSEAPVPQAQTISTPLVTEPVAPQTESILPVYTTTAEPPAKSQIEEVSAPAVNSAPTGEPSPTEIKPEKQPQETPKYETRAQRRSRRA